MYEILTTALGESDCETIGGSFLAQPVNAASSFAYVVFGVYLTLSLARAEGPERGNRKIFAVLLIATGIGSVMYHGTQGLGAPFLHDLSFVSALLFLAVMNVAGTFGVDRRRALAAFTSAVLVVSGLLVLWPGSTNLIAAATVVLLIIGDISGHRRGTTTRNWRIASAVAMGTALLLFVGGRTGGPLCDAESLFQGHALWHLLSAAALWTYFEATVGSRAGTGSMPL